MHAEAETLHAISVQEPPTDEPRPDEALLELSLDELEEAGGELHRRIAMALRLLGEGRADRASPGAASPRWRVASLLASTELAAATLATIAARAPCSFERIDQHAATIAALMYAAPSIPALLTRLEQDRRLLTSLARNLEERFDTPYATPWGEEAPRRLVTTVTVLDAARCAVALEQVINTADV